MITKPAFSKTLYAALFATAMLFGSSAAFAQVKIGTNPTLINAANNLEVEASTTGRKTSIDKVTGQVTIKDGTEANKKVLTSDANGNASWQASASQTSPVQVKLLQNTTQSLAINETDNTLAFGTVDFDLGSNAVGNTIVISEPGLYDITAQVNFGSSAFVGGGAYGLALRLFTNNVFNQQIDGQVVNAGTLQQLGGRVVARLLAGDILKLVVVTQQTAGTASANSGQFVVFKLSN